MGDRELEYRSQPSKVQEFTSASDERETDGSLLLRLDGGEKKCGKMYKWMIVKNG